MTELLTESFCERCGTRYTFESAAPRKSRLGKVRTLSKGMKNFVLSDDASFSEAMAEARSEEELAAVAHQLDAFHQTFNFCLTCRQYTCGDCWNTAEGRCLTCAPIPGMEEPVRASAMPAMEAIPPADGAAADLAWPDEDLSSARLSRALGFDTAEAEATAEVAELDESFHIDAARAAAAAIAAGGAAPDEQAVAADAVEDAAPPPPAAPRVEGLAPGQSLEDAIAAYEAAHVADGAAEPVESVAEAVGVEAVAAEAAVAPADEVAPVEAVAPAETVTPAEPEAAAVEPEAEAPSLDPLAAALAAAALAAPDETPLDLAPEPEPEPVAEAAAQPLADAAPEPVLAEATPEPLATPEPPTPEPVAAAPEPLAAAPEPASAPQVDVVAQPVWPSPAPSLGGTADGSAPANPWLTVAPDEAGEQPQWPATPQWPSAPAGFRESPSTLAGRPLQPRDDASALWAASAAEVLTGGPTQAPAPQAPAAAAPTAQPCVSCGLSLSANARFCRRCGTRQG